MAEKLTLDAQISTKFDDKGFEKAKKATDDLAKENKALAESFEKIEERAREMAGTLGGPSAGAIAETEQDLRRLMETVNEGSDEWREYEQRLEAVNKDLAKSRENLVENETAVEKLTLETQAAVRRNQSLRTSLTQGRKGLEGYAVAAGQVGAAFSGGFAIGLGIAKKAGVDLTETMDVLDGALTNVAKGIVALISPATDFAADVINDWVFGVEKLTEAEQEALNQSIAASDARLVQLQQEAVERRKAEEERRKALEAERLAAEEDARIRAEELAYFQEKARLKVIERENELALQGFSEVRLQFLSAALQAEASLLATEEERVQASIAAAEQIIAIREAEMEAKKALSTAETEWERMNAQQRANAAIGGISAGLAAAQGAFGESKELAIAQAIINTYQSATAAYNSLAVIPIVGPALGAIAAALAVVAGLKNVQQIKASEPAGGGKGAGGEAAPSFDDPANDAAARFAGRMSARDVAGHFGDGFRQELLAGQAHLAAGSTAGPPSAPSSSTVINVEGSFATPPRAFVRTFSRAQRQNDTQVESRVTRPRKRRRR